MDYTLFGAMLNDWKFSAMGTNFSGLDMVWNFLIGEFWFMILCVFIVLEWFSILLDGGICRCGEGWPDKQCSGHNFFETGLAAPQKE